MKTLEIKRHAMRNKPDKHLSKQGTELAKFAGKQMGKYELVITSALPRAIETATQMGYSVDKQISELGELPETIQSKIRWPNTLSAISEITRENSDRLKFSVDQASLWQSQLKAAPEESRILTISHGGIMELGNIGCLSQNSQIPTEDPFGYCEGVRMKYQGSSCARINFIRMPANRQLVIK